MKGLTLTVMPDRVYIVNDVSFILFPYPYNINRTLYNRKALLTIVVTSTSFLSLSAACAEQLSAITEKIIENVELRNFKNGRSL